MRLAIPFESHRLPDRTWGKAWETPGRVTAGRADGCEGARSLDTGPARRRPDAVSERRTRGNQELDAAAHHRRQAPRSRLGGWPLVTLAEARDQAFENRRIARRGGDPLADRRRAKAPTVQRVGPQELLRESETDTDAELDSRIASLVASGAVVREAPSPVGGTRSSDCALGILACGARGTAGGGPSAAAGVFIHRHGAGASPGRRSAARRRSGSGIFARCPG